MYSPQLRGEMAIWNYGTESRERSLLWVTLDQTEKVSLIGNILAQTHMERGSELCRYLVWGCCLENNYVIFEEQQNETEPWRREGEGVEETRSEEMQAM
jgi:hypothetical protein